MSRIITKQLKRRGAEIGRVWRDYHVLPIAAGCSSRRRPDIVGTRFLQASITAGKRSRFSVSFCGEIAARGGPPREPKDWTMNRAICEQNEGRRAESRRVPAQPNDEPNNPR